MRTVVYLMGLSAATLWSAACHTLQPATFRQIDVRRPAQVWVTQSDQSTAVIEGPQVFGDTLVGYIDGVYREIPASELSEVRMKRPAKGKTAALIIGTAALIGGFSALVSNTGGFDDITTRRDCDDDPDHPDCTM